MRSITRILLVCLPIVFAGCSVPEVRLRVSGNRVAPVVELKNPFFMKGLPVLQELQVYRGAPPHRGKASECKVVASRDPLPLAKWQIGTVPTGFRLERCEPLDSGERYTVSVHAVGGLGSRPFAIRADGTVDDLGIEWE